MSRMAWIVFGAALAAGGAGASAFAQRNVQSSLELGGRTLALSPLELARITDLGHVVHASRALQDRALAAARAVVNSTDARYAFAIYQLEIGRQRRDDLLRAEGLDVLIASRDTPPERIAGYLGLRGDIALRSRDYATASAAWTRLAEMRPNDPQALVNLAQVRAAQDDAAGAADLIRRGIEARGSGSEPAPEGWYRQWLSIAYNGGLAEQGAAAAHALVDTHPTPENWRFALVAYRQLAAPQQAAEIDLLRLMRVAGALARPAEYQRLAQLLLHAGFVAEARATLDEGLSRGILDRARYPIPEIIAEMDRAASRRPDRRAPRPRRSASDTADTLLGEGRFSEAAASYRIALQQDGTDSAATNTRLGAALALAGRRGEAETAFRAAAGNAQGGAAPAFYPDLARFWLSWLARSG